MTDISHLQFLPALMQRVGKVAPEVHIEVMRITSVGTGLALWPTVSPDGRFVAYGYSPVPLAEATAVGADLLIKGAYTQSRLRQMIFGGATSHILANAMLPVFMAH